MFSEIQSVNCCLLQQHNKTRVYESQFGKHYFYYSVKSLENSNLQLNLLLLQFAEVIWVFCYNCVLFRLIILSITTKWRIVGITFINWMQQRMMSFLTII